MDSIKSPAILIIDGHPNPESFSNAIAAALLEAVGPENARILALRDLKFDPILRMGYRESQPLEPDLESARRAIADCSHLVIVTPVWWGSVPALLKGFMDRVLLPGFAFKYRKGSPFWDRLLSGRSATLYFTMDSPAWWFRFVYGNPAINMMKRTVLEFCGFKPVKVRIFDKMRFRDAAKRTSWLDRIRKDGLRQARMLK